MRSATRSAWALVGVLAAAAVCGHGVAPPPPAPGLGAPQAQRPAALVAAIAAYHDDDELGPLERWVAQNPDHDEAYKWREIVALRRYEAAAVTPKQPDPVKLAAIAKAYPNTIAGETIAGVLDHDKVRRIAQPLTNPLLLDMLSGGSQWIEAAGLRSAQVPGFRSRHEDRLRQALASRLLDDGCETTVGYCQWWIAHYPGAPETAMMADALARIWYRRAHPRWQGRRYRNCVMACAQKCKASADLEDACYPPCSSAC